MFYIFIVDFNVANLSAVAISRPSFGINIPRFVSRVLLPTRVRQASVLEIVKTSVFTFRSCVKPAQVALEVS